MAIGIPWVGTPVHGSTTGTTVTLDFTGATVGEWCYAAVALADSQAAAPTAPAGWTIVVQGSEGTSGASSSRLILYRRKKQAGDTTQAFIWGTTCKYEALPWSWPGLDGTTPDEGAVYLAHASTVNFATGSVTPTSTDRWIGMVAAARGTTSLETWTPDAAMTERSDSNHGGTNPFVAIELADTNTAVTQAAHTYTAVCSVADSHGGTVALALIPAAGTTAKSDSDTAGSAESASLTVAEAASDTAAGVDGTVLAVALAVSDTGSGADSAASLAAAATTADTGAVLDSRVLATTINSTDSGSTVERETGRDVTGADNTGVADLATLTTVATATDTATSSDSTVLAATHLLADTAALAEAATARDAVATDAAGTAETALVTATSVAVDTAAAVEDAVVTIVGGVTPRPSTGTTVYDRGVTPRPFTGTTTRP